MGILFAYSLTPVVAVSLLLGFTAVLRGRGALGLALYCFSVAIWSGALLLIALPQTAAWGETLASAGVFTAAGFLHAAYDATQQKTYRLVVFAYVSAAILAVLGGAFPGLLYGPRAMNRGPLFWPAMVLAVAAATVPLFTLARAYPHADPERRALLRNLGIAGVLTYVGALSNALTLSAGWAQPISLYIVLAGLLVLANVVRAHEPAAERRLLERSLLYSAITALLSSGFLFGVMNLASEATQPLLRSYRFGALFLLALAALALEPLRQGLVEWMAQRLAPGRSAARAVAHELGVQETRADQATRLAELGTFVSAVAHEVRNPLGVLGGHVRLLERAGVEAETLGEMRQQIDRASRFVDDLLRYGRPQPLELRLIDLDALIDLAITTARQGLGDLAQGIACEAVHAPASNLIEADQTQLLQALIILVENALLAVASMPTRQVRASIVGTGSTVQLVIEDSGPGISASVRDRLFQPFVSGRGRESARPGTGLGLAIARGIAMRHHGELRAGVSAMGGARFELSLPRAQPLLAPAAPAPLA